MYCTNCTSPIPAERQARKGLSTAVTCNDDCLKAFRKARHQRNKYKVTSGDRALLKRIKRIGITLANWDETAPELRLLRKARQQANGLHSEAANGFATEAIEGV